VLVTTDDRKNARSCSVFRKDKVWWNALLQRGCFGAEKLATANFETNQREEMSAKKGDAIERWIEIFSNSGVAFIHVPRAAGTSLEFGLFQFDEYPGRQFLRAKELQDRIGEEKFDSLFKIASVRNPFNRLVSAYEIQVTDGFEEHETFADFVESLVEMKEEFGNLWWERCPRAYWPQTSFLSNKFGDIMVDVVVAQENLQRGIDMLRSGKADPAGLDRKIDICLKLPKLQTRGTRQNSFEAYYGDERILANVADLYADDFEIFGYDKTGKDQLSIRVKTRRDNTLDLQTPSPREKKTSEGDSRDDVTVCSAESFSQQVQIEEKEDEVNAREANSSFKVSSGKLLESQRQLEESCSRLQNFKARMKSLGTRLDDELGAERLLEDHVSRLLDGRADLLNKSQELENDLAATTLMTKELRKEMDRKDSAALKAAAEQEEQISELRDKERHLRQLLDSERAENHRLILSNKEDKRKAAENLEEAMEELESCRKLLSSTQSQVRDAMNRSTKLATQLQEETEARSQVEARNARLEESMSESLSRAETAEAKSIVLLEQLDESTTSNQQLSKSKLNLENELAQVKAELQTLKRSKNCVLGRPEEDEGPIDEEIIKIFNAQAQDIERLNHTAKGLEQNLMRQTTARNAAESELKRYAKEMKMHSKEHADKIVALETIITELRQTIHQLTADIE